MFTFCSLQRQFFSEKCYEVENFFNWWKIKFRGLTDWNYKEKNIFHNQKIKTFLKDYNFWRHQSIVSTNVIGLRLNVKFEIVVQMNAFCPSFWIKIKQKATKIQWNDSYISLPQKVFTQRKNGNINNQPMLKFYKMLFIVESWLLNVHSKFATKMLSKTGVTFLEKILLKEW